MVAIDGIGTQVLAEASCELTSKGGGEEGHVAEESGVQLFLLVVITLRSLVLLLRGTRKCREGRGCRGRTRGR